MLKALRLTGFLEGVSYLLLFFTMYLKYIQEMPLPNKVVGMAHGLLFVAYCGLVIYVAHEHRWDKKTAALALFASLIPFGTFVADKKIFSA